MADTDSAGEFTPLQPTEPSSKRRRTSTGYSSPDEIAAPSQTSNIEEPPSRRTSIRPATSRSPGRKLVLSDDELNADDGAHNTRSRTRSRTRSPARSKSRTRTRERTRSRSNSRSTRRSPSRSRSRSRLRSQSDRSRSRSSNSPSPSRSNRTSSPRSLSEKVDRHLRLSADADAEAESQPPPRQPVKPNYQPHLSLTGHRQPVSQVRISPDGRWIASASADGTVKIWDAETGEHMDTLVGHMAGISCVGWSPDSCTLATGSDDKAIRLWDRVTGRPQVSAKGAATSKDGVGARPMPPLLGHHNYVMCLAFSPKGNILASGSYDEAVFLWDVRAGRLMRSLPAHSDPVSGIGFSMDGTLVVSCSTDGLIRIWDTYTGQCLRTLVHEDNPAVSAACFAPNGRYVLAFNLDNCIRLWDYVSGTVKKTYQGHRNSGFAISGCFGVLPRKSGEGDAFIASPSEDGDVVMWDVSSKEIVQRVSAHPGMVCFWVDIRDEIMVTGGQDGSLKVFRHRGEEGEEPAVDGDLTAVNGDVEMDEDPVVANGGSGEDPDGIAKTTEQNGAAAETPIKLEDVEMGDGQTA